MNRRIYRVRRPRIGFFQYLGMVALAFGQGFLEEYRKRKAYGDRMPRQARRRQARLAVEATGRRLEARRKGGIWSRLTLWWLRRFGVEDRDVTGNALARHDAEEARAAR